MNACEWLLAAVASCFACACAQAYDTPSASTLESTVLMPSGGGGAATDALGGMGGMPVPVGEPCVQGDVSPCPCEATMAQGQRVCMFDMSSPTQGFLSACQGCPPPSPPDAGVTPAGGPGGMADSSSASGEGGASGAEAGSGGDEEPAEPVDSCDAVPEGTECDRRCLLPGNTAHCNARGDCSCL